MKILLTGGGGFIGANLRSHFDKNNIEYILLSRNEWMGKDNFAKLSNILASDDEYIFIHLAGISNIAYCDENYDECFFVNSYAVEKLLEFLDRKKVKEFIYASSMAVYGDIIDNGSEDNELLGHNNYAKSKILGEKFVESWVKNDNNYATILRIGNCYGATSDGKIYPRGVISYIINSILSNLDITLDFNSSSYKSAEKSFISLDDLSSLFINIYYKKEQKNNLEVYNAVGDFHKSIYDIFRLAILQLNYNGVLKIKFSDQVYNGVGSNTKAKNDLNWYPKSNLDSDIIRYLRSGRVL